MPLVQTRGAASAQGFGEFAQAAAVPIYIEDVFSTFLYTGTGATLTITNNIDLSTKGGLTWIKGRSGGTDHKLTDTARGATKALKSNSTAAQTTDTTGLTAFGTTGFTIGADADYNTSAATYVSWTFREQPKFFDVVTYTGTGSNTTIAHSLGSVPGSIFVKRTDTTAAWAVYHRSLANTQYLVLNTDAGVATGATWWNSTTPTSSVFSVGTDASVNASGGTYVAYIFAHDAGGFGLTGTDNVISCGTFTTDGSSEATVNLGYEPQWLLIKTPNSGGYYWQIVDNMRNMSNAGNSVLYPNLNSAETVYTSGGIVPTATGFKGVSGGGNWLSASTPYIYIAIRRGPMKVPTVGTTVFAPNARVGTGAASAQVTNISFPPDMSLTKVLNATNKAVWFDRIRGPLKALNPSDTDAEASISGTLLSFNMNGISIGNTGESTYDMNYTRNYVDWFFRRAPGFFDEVCYTGSLPSLTVPHNLQAVPELIIVKGRSAVFPASGYRWTVYSATLGTSNAVFLNTNEASSSVGSTWDSTTPTSTNFYVGNQGPVNYTGEPLIAYLFATCAGVSKVGSYTGNGSTQTINCGFTGGARFVVIKRTDSTGDWYVWDSARGIVAGNDSHLSLNTTAPEVTSDDSVDTDNTGFIVNQDSATNINVTSATYIFLSVA